MYRKVHVLLLAGLLLASFLAHGDDREYGIKEDQPRTGSLIRRYEMLGSPLPINKRYDQLTSEEKDSLNQYYERVEPGDEPPFPAQGLKPIYDAVRKAQSRLLVTGRLFLIVEVGASGEATAVKVIDSPSPEMTKFAASVLMLTKYKPAVCSGMPCQMEFPLSVHFNVR